MAKKHSKKTARTFFTPLRTVIALAVVLVIAAGIVLVPRLINRCDNCDKVFVGTGYKANFISNTITSISGKESKVLCRSCAEKEHAVSIAAGASLDDFKLPLFPKKGK